MKIECPVCFEEIEVNHLKENEEMILPTLPF